MPSRLTTLTICVIAWPDWMRRAQASVEFLKCAKSFGIVRVPLVPSAWHDMQPLVLTLVQPLGLALHVSAMPLPLAPVPGNSLLAGIFSIEYQ